MFCKTTTLILINLGLLVSLTASVQTTEHNTDWLKHQLNQLVVDDQEKDVKPVFDSKDCQMSMLVNTKEGGITVKYEWYKNTLNSARLADITNLQRGTATSSLTLINQQVTASYYVRVTDANGHFIPYGPIKLTVNSGSIVPLGGRLAAEEGVELKITLLGNPIIGEQLRATVSGAAGKALTVQLLDLSGKMIRDQQWQQAESDQPIEWNLGGQASGVYLLQAVTHTDGSIPAQRPSLKVIKP